jgi:uracil permease
VFAIIALVGLNWVNKVLPPVVVGPVVMIIGLSLTPVAISQASKGLITAFLTAGIVIVCSLWGKGFFKIIPILIGTIGGYLIAIGQGQVNFDAINNAAWIALPKLTIVTGNMPVLAWGAVSLIAPIAIATIVEDVGHLLVIGDTVDRDLMRKPGLHKVLLGNGVATFIGGLLGGVPLTTYGENIGVLAITRVFSARVIQGAALIAILLSFVQKFGAAIQTIPEPVLGGITIILYGMIAAVGLRNLVENKVNLSNNRNLLIVSVIFTLGVGGIALNFGQYSFQGVGPAAIIGIFLNLVLPKDKEEEVSVK